MTRDLRSDAQAFHVYNATVYSSGNNDTAGSIDISQWQGGIVVTVNIGSLAANTTFTILDSDDNSSFAATSYAVTIPSAGFSASSRYFFIHPSKVRRWVKLRFNSAGNTTLAANGIAYMRKNGVVDITNYAIDTMS